ncbi:hypothetical protein [Rubrobacter aplysinae]|uniref:hypothetical protein n=1 Tax=Rubrobacter aplysinae TaxID=909625 RepID=UPI00064C2979|nr:hypothetical protein [Rubrobacter aplysinae]
MELKTKDEIRNEILQEWLRNAWVYPQQGPDEQQYLRLTPGGRLKLRRRIGEMESSLGVSGRELLGQEETGELPAEREKLELAMAVQAYTSERQLIQSQGGSLGSSAVSSAQETGEEPGGSGEETPPAE